MKIRIPHETVLYMDGFADNEKLLSSLVMTKKFEWRYSTILAIKLRIRSWMTCLGSYKLRVEVSDDQDTGTCWRPWDILRRTQEGLSDQWYISVYGRPYRPFNLVEVDNEEIIKFVSEGQVSSHLI